MSIKTIIVCASALVLGFCGCSDNNGGAGGAGAVDVATAPRALEGALVSAGAEKAAFDKLLGDMKDGFYQGFKESMPDDFKDALSKAGLDDIEVKWCGVSVVDVELDESGEPAKIPEMVVALAFDHDFGKISATLKEVAAKENKPQTKDATFLGEKGLVLFDDNVTIALSSVAGKILVVGTSEPGAEKAVALYRDGKGGKAITMDGAALKAMLNSVGSRVISKMPASNFEGALGPDIDAVAVFKGLKDATVNITPAADNAVSIAVKIETASADDAGKVVAFVNEQIAGFRDMMTMMAAQSPDAKPMADALNSLSVKAEGAAISASVTVAGDTVGKAIEDALD